MRRIAVVTSSRADLDLLHGVVEGLHVSPLTELQLIVTGSHLATGLVNPDSGIGSWGIPIARRIEMLLDSDTRVGASKALGVGTLAFADVFAELKPDILVLLGDRFELLAPASVALVQGIPIAHIHGGEVTEGAFDDAVRHAITKMASVHFVAAPEYRDRVVQLGEEPERIHVVGGLGVDTIMRSRLLTREEVETRLNLALGNRSVLVTFHPVTLDNIPSEDQLCELLEALDRCRLTSIVFTAANADPEGRKLNALIQEYVQITPIARLFKSLGDPLYASCVAAVDAVVGNSSSGLLEAPALRTATVNIGSRQTGRLRASSVIDCAAQVDAIEVAICRALSPKFMSSLSNVHNPYGEGGAGSRVIEILETVELNGLPDKRFFDLASVAGIS